MELEAKQLRAILSDLLREELGEFAYHIPGEDVLLESGVEIGDTEVVVSSLWGSSNIDEALPLEAEPGSYLIFSFKNPLYFSSLRVMERKVIGKHSTVKVEMESGSGITQNTKGEFERKRFPSIRTYPPQLSNYFRMVPNSGIEVTIERSPEIEVKGHTNFGICQKKTFEVIVDQYNREGDLNSTAELIAREFHRDGAIITIRPQQETESGLTFARLSAKIPVVNYVRHIPHF